MTLLGGCAVFLPGSLYSNERRGEKINLTLIKTENCSGLITQEEKKKFFDNYHKVFPTQNKMETSDCPDVNWSFVISQKNECRDPSLAEAAPIAALVATAAIGFATDFIKKKMEEEKSLYAAQYSARQLVDDFWIYKESNWIELSPTKLCKLSDGKPGTIHSKETNLKANYLGFKVERRINNHEDISSKIENQASVFYYGFMPSADRRFIQIRPLKWRH